MTTDKPSERAIKCAEEIATVCDSLFGRKSARQVAANEQIAAIIDKHFSELAEVAFEFYRLMPFDAFCGGEELRAKNHYRRLIPQAERTSDLTKGRNERE